MRKLALVVLAAAVGAAPALAQDQAALQDPDRSADQSVRVTGSQQLYKLQPQQLAEIAGVYSLDNGAVFRMSKQGSHLMARLGERDMTELVAQSDTRFISRDQRMTVVYQPMAFGDQIVLTYPSDLARLDSPMVTVRLALN